MKHILLTLIVLMIAMSVNAQVKVIQIYSKSNTLVAEYVNSSAASYNVVFSQNVESGGQKITIHNKTKNKDIKTYSDEYKAVFKLQNQFSVSDSKKVFFTKSNLYWNGSDFAFESSQTNYTTAWDANHVDRFYWTKEKENSYEHEYSEEGSTSDRFFADGSDSEHMLTVDGISDLYVLSSADWDYLLKERERADNLCNKNVTIGSVSNCLVIAPDSYSGTIADTYTASEWATAEANGFVCIPAAGYRYTYISSGDDVKDNFIDVASKSCAWSSTPKNDESACYVYNGDVSEFGQRHYACMIRLVKTVPE